ncbi:MAG TPA: hypothetical protein VGL19_07720, partial [Polyangiaceae bacterium]
MPSLAVGMAFGYRMWREARLLGLVLAIFGFRARIAQGETLQAAVDSRAFYLSQGRVACAAPTGGWAIEPGSGAHALRAPVTNEAVGSAVVLKVAASAAACASNASSVELVATAHPPLVDATSVV